MTHYQAMMQIYGQLDYRLRRQLAGITAEALTMDLTAQRRAMVLQQIEATMKQANVQLSAVENDALEVFWRDQAAITTRQINAAGIFDQANMATWATIDQGAIRAIAADMANTRARFLGLIHNATGGRQGGILRQTDDFLRTLAGTEIPAALAGEPVYQVGAAIRDRGIDALRSGQGLQTLTEGLDKCLGVTYADNSFHSLHAYGQMSARTGVMRARTESNFQTMTDRGVHLFMVSTHGTICPLCLPFEGTVWAIDAEGEAMGYQRCPVTWPRHPQCSHSVYAHGGTPRETKPKEPPACAFEDDKAQRAWLKETHPQWYQAGRQGFGTQAEWNRAKHAVAGEGASLKELRGPRYRYRNIEQRRLDATAKLLKDPKLSYSGAMSSVTNEYMSTPAYAKARGKTGEFSPAKQQKLVEENWVSGA